MIHLLMLDGKVVYESPSLAECKAEWEERKGDEELISVENITEINWYSRKDIFDYKQGGYLYQYPTWNVDGETLVWRAFYVNGDRSVRGYRPGSSPKFEAIEWLLEVMKSDRGDREEEDLEDKFVTWGGKEVCVERLIKEGISVVEKVGKFDERWCFTVYTGSGLGVRNHFFGFETKKKAVAARNQLVSRLSRDMNVTFDDLKVSRTYINPPGTLGNDGNKWILHVVGQVNSYFDSKKEAVEAQERLADRSLKDEENGK